MGNGYPHLLWQQQSMPHLLGALPWMVDRIEHFPVAVHRSSHINELNPD
jgi:hypothetical protein